LICRRSRVRASRINPRSQKARAEDCCFSGTVFLQGSKTSTLNMLAWAVVWQPPPVVDLQATFNATVWLLEVEFVTVATTEAGKLSRSSLPANPTIFWANGKNLWRRWVLSSVGRRQPRTASNRPPPPWHRLQKSPNEAFASRKMWKVQVFPVAAGQVTLIGANMAVFARQPVVLHIAFASFVSAIRVVDARVSLLMMVWAVTAGVATSDTTTQANAATFRRCVGISFAASLEILWR